jgi:hypothetical protein
MLYALQKFHAFSIGQLICLLCGSLGTFVLDTKSPCIWQNSQMDFNFFGV